LTTLANGRPAVIKIQRPGVRETVAQDMALLRKAARVAGRIAPRFTEILDIEAMLEALFEAMRPELACGARCDGFLGWCEEYGHDGPSVPGPSDRRCRTGETRPARRWPWTG
jgi:hypothetical protein